MLEIIELSVRGQALTTNKVCVASGLVNEIECHFTTDWDMDEIRAVFENNARGKKISVVLVDGKCNCPHEVLFDKGEVNVNLVGSVIEGTELIERMTSYKTKIIEVKQKVNLDGANSATPTPEVWEQDVARLQGEIDELDERVDELEVRPSVEKLNDYLYKVTYTELPEEAVANFRLGGCSSYVQDGLLYRNLDWDYNEDKSFIVDAPNFTGMAFGSLDELNTLPYKVVDGVNKYGIKIATHILFNDFDWVGTGDIPLYKLPFIALSTMQSIDDVYDLPLSELKGVESLGEYIAQYIVTDGTTTYAILPSESGYVVQDITSNPKLTNFRWVEDETVTRDMLQDRPTGVERWNLMPCTLSDLRFTKAYESPTRLSEFIGINGTTKDSTNAELMPIYEQAREIYLERARDGRTWQTMHSVVYGDEMEHLYIQENWDKDYIASGGGTSDYNSLNNKPKINGHELRGNKTTEDLGLFSGDYNDLDNKPEIPSLDGYATEDYVDTKVSQEAQARQSADTTLQTNITNEATARQQADTALGGRIDTEATTRANADTALQGQIDALVSKSDVVDVVNTYADLQAYDTSTLGDNDVVKVLTDSTHDNARSYYRWSTTTETWTYVGSEAIGYTKAEADSKFALITAISDMATKAWVNAQGFITSLVGYATEQWVLAKNYASQAWVEAKGYLTSSALNSYRTSANQDVIDATKVGEAPEDGRQYARQDGEWVEAQGVDYLEVVNGKLNIIYEEVE